MLLLELRLLLLLLLLLRLLLLLPRLPPWWALAVRSGVRREHGLAGSGAPPKGMSP